MALGSGFNILSMKNAGLLVTGGLSAIATTVVPPMLAQFTGTNRWVQYGVQAGVGIGGGMLIAKAIGRNHGVVWTVVGLAVTIANILKAEVLPMLGMTLGDYTVSDYTVIQESPDQISAFPGDGVTMGAFPYQEQNAW